MMMRFLMTCVLAAGLATSSQAALTKYEDRISFEAALAGVSVDDLNDLPDVGAGFAISRPDYDLNGSFYNCVAGTFQCGDNSGAGFTYPAYVWNYNVTQTVTFKSAFNGFGFDFAALSSGPASIEGENASSDAGFLGVISDTPLTQFQYYSVTRTTLLIDNVTYGNLSLNPPQSIPLPAGLPLIASGAVMLAFLRNRRRA